MFSRGSQGSSGRSTFPPTGDKPVIQGMVTINTALSNADCIEQMNPVGRAYYPAPVNDRGVCMNEREIGFMKLTPANLEQSEEPRVMSVLNGITGFGGQNYTAIYNEMVKAGVTKNVAELVIADATMANLSVQGVTEYPVIFRNSDSNEDCALIRGGTVQVASHFHPIQCGEIVSVYVPTKTEFERIMKDTGGRITLSVRPSQAQTFIDTVLAHWSVWREASAVYNRLFHDGLLNGTAGYGLALDELCNKGLLNAVVIVDFLMQKRLISMDNSLCTNAVPGALGNYVAAEYSAANAAEYPVEDRHLKIPFYRFANGATLDPSDPNGGAGAPGVQLRSVSRRWFAPLLAAMFGIITPQHSSAGVEGRYYAQAFATNPAFRQASIKFREEAIDTLYPHSNERRLNRREIGFAFQEGLAAGTVPTRSQWYTESGHDKEPVPDTRGIPGKLLHCHQTNFSSTFLTMYQFFATHQKDKFGRAIRACGKGGRVDVFSSASAI